MSNEEIEQLNRAPSTRRTIHSEIEEALVKKLFTIVETIEVLPNGQLNFKPYTDYVLLQLETFLEKKFNEKIFNRTEDKQINFFLEQVKSERERREFNLSFDR